MPSTSPRRRTIFRSRLLRQAIVLSLLMLGLPLLTPFPKASAASAAETCIQPNRACTSWTPVSGPRGTTVTIAGRNWEGYSPGRSSEVFWGFAPSTGLGRLTITPEGTFSATVKVPDSAPLGQTSIDILGDFTPGRPLTFDVTGGAPSLTPSGPRFQSPQDGQTLYLEDPWIFKVNPVDGASGYLWGFFQNGKMIWENYRDERKLSGAEYDIRPGTPAYKAFAKGDVQVWVRALIDGKWTEATIITIHVQPKVASCPQYVLGLHGMEQGPSDDPNYADSPELKDTVEAFQDKSSHLTSSDYAYQFVAYPTTPLLNYKDSRSILNIVPDVERGVEALDMTVKSATASCATATFSLVGYSQGAWVVNKWLHMNQSKWSSVKGVVLYGDPQYYRWLKKDSHGFVLAHVGLARLGGQSVYGPPYPLQRTPFKIMSYCIPNDPVCGEGFISRGLVNRGNQWAKAVCGSVSSCPHLQYVSQGITRRGGEFLAEQAWKR